MLPVGDFSRRFRLLASSFVPRSLKLASGVAALRPKKTTRLADVSLKRTSG